MIDAGDSYKSANRGPALLGALAFALVVARLAWLSDDAAITARVIANTLGGYGPNFNITERAQAFTHPLWFLVNTGVAAVNGDIVLTMIVVSLLCSAGAAYLILHRRHWAVVLVLTLAMTSVYALAEFGAAGLENPLSWLLLAGLWWAAREERPVIAAAVGGLVLLNRLDLALVVVPFMLLWTTRQLLPRGLALRVVALVVAPALAWAVGAWLYYGSPLPETAYSKLNTAIPQRELFAQGLRYALDLTLYDAVAVLVLLAAAVAVFSARVTFPSALLAVSGILIYGTYVVWIGGDFMSGRFWTVPVFAALPAIGDGLEELIAGAADGVLAGIWTAAAVVVAVVVPTLLAPPVGLPMFRDPVVPEPRANIHTAAGAGIVDEWTFSLHQSRGMMQWAVQEPYDNFVEQMREHLAAWDESETVDRIDVRCGSVGFDAIEAGPGTHFVVSCGLSDPFLSRIEFEGEDRQWRIGHFDREIPPGYFEALSTGSPDHLPPDRRELFRQVSLPRRIPQRWASEVTWP